MNGSRFLTALVLIGVVGVSIWSVSTWSNASRGDALNILAGVPGQQSMDRTQLDGLPVAAPHDHGFVFPPQY